MRTEPFIPVDQLAPAVAFNDWLRERLRSILDASVPCERAAPSVLSPDN